MIGLDNRGTEPCLVARDVLRLQRMLRAPGVSTADVARAFDVSQRTVYRYQHAKVARIVVMGHVLHMIQWTPEDRPRMLPDTHHQRKVGAT